jgi:murein DD-endopeptidase MepM/ murein hydrolase activator NlpD
MSRDGPMSFAQQVNRRRTPERRRGTGASVGPRCCAVFSCVCLAGFAAVAQPFHLPTANHAFFEAGGQQRFFVGTTGQPWTTGTFGCVRGEGWQMHEGLDIRCQQRDARGEPTDAVLATADGSVAYVNRRAPLSNYGHYVILRHVIEGLEIFSLYAHLAEVRADLRVGQTVKAGEPIAVMGRTANTRERITPERAHLHFELDLLLNERFGEWYRRTFPAERNDHGQWNGQNLVGLDPRAVLLAQRRLGTNFSLLALIRGQTELCRVLVRDTRFPWLTRYAALVQRNPVAERAGVAGYELALNFNGLPFRVVPRAASEIQGRARVQLLSVNEAEQRERPCRRLVVKRGARWELSGHGANLVSLLTY